MTRRWTVVALLTTATVISYLDRQTLSVVAPQVRDELGLSNFDYARIVFCVSARIHAGAGRRSAG